MLREQIGGETEIRPSAAFPPESLLVLPLGSQIEGMADGERYGRAARLPHRQAAQAAGTVGADLHRH